MRVPTRESRSLSLASCVRFIGGDAKSTTSSKLKKKYLFVYICVLSKFLNEFFHFFNPPKKPHQKLF